MSDQINDEAFFCSSIRTLSVKKLTDHRYVTICMDAYSIVVLLPLIIMVAMYYETYRQLISKYLLVGKKISRQIWYMWLLATVTSLFPIYYNHEAIFLYLNEMWYQLCFTQTVLTISENLALLLRWSYPFLDFLDIEFGVRVAHLVFNISAESSGFINMRNLLFLVDDIVSIMLILYRLDIENSVTLAIPGTDGGRQTGHSSIKSPMNSHHNYFKNLWVIMVTKLRAPMVIIGGLFSLAPFFEQRITR